MTSKSPKSTMSTMSVASMVGNCHLPAVLPWHLPVALHWPLLALPLSSCLAPGSTGMAVGAIGGISISFGLSLSLGLCLWCSFSFPLSISMASITASDSSSGGCNPMASSDQLAVVTNNTRAVVDPLAHLVALLGHNVLAVLHIGGVHDSVVLSVTDRPGHLARVLDGSLLALPLSSGLALWAAGVAIRSIGGVSIGIGISFSLGLGISLSLPLAITVTSVSSMASNSSNPMASSDQLAVMSNNSGAGLNPLAHLVALLSHNILAVLHIGGVHDSVVLLVAHFPGHLSRVLNRDQLAVVTNHTRAVVDPLVHFMTLLSYNVLTVFDVGGVDDCLVGLMALLVAVAGHTSCHCSEAGKGDKELHTDC